MDKSTGADEYENETAKAKNIAKIASTLLEYFSFSK